MISWGLRLGDRGRTRPRMVARKTSELTELIGLGCKVFLQNRVLGGGVSNVLYLRKKPIITLLALLLPLY